MRKIFVFFGLVCFLGSVTGCGGTKALFNSKLEKDSQMYRIILDHPTTAAKMIRACRNAVPEVSSDLKPGIESSDQISFSIIGWEGFYFGTGEEYNLIIKCELLNDPSKKNIVISTGEQGPPGSVKLPGLKEKIEQMVDRVKRES